MPFVTWLIHLPSKLLHPACSQLELINGKWQTASGCHLPLVTWLILPFSTLVHPACSQLELINVKWQTANGRGATCHLPSGSFIPFQPWFIQPALNLSSSVASVKWLPLATWLIHPVATPVHLACSQLELISGKWQVAGVPLANWLIHLFSWPQNPTFTKCLAIVHSRLLGQLVGACWVNLFVFLQFFADPAYIFSSTRCI